MVRWPELLPLRRKMLVHCIEMQSGGGEGEGWKVEGARSCCHGGRRSW